MAEASLGDTQDNQEIDTQHGTSDQFVNPWCELCILDSKEKIEAVGYCPECNTLLCRSCVDIHRRWPMFQTHRIWRGSKMPKYQAEKPVRYPDCQTHDGRPNDHYCFQHIKLVCSACIKQDHGNCNIMPISDVCKELGPTDIKRFKTTVLNIKGNAETAKSMLEKNVADLEKKETELIKAAEVARDTIISKAGELCQWAVSSISEICRTQKIQIKDKMSIFSDDILYFDDIIENIHATMMTTADFCQNTFLHMQQIVEKTRTYTREIEDMISELQIANLTFATSSNVSNFLADVKELGNVTEELTKLDVNMDTDVKFPITFQTDTKQKSIQQIQTQKMPPINVRAPDEKETCSIKGMCFDSQGFCFLADYTNKSLKLISQDRKIISHFSLDFEPRDVEILDDSSTVVITGRKHLHLCNVSNTVHLSISKTLPLSYKVVRVDLVNGNIAATCWGDENTCVKLITMEGNEIWSVSADELGQQLFENPFSLVCNAVNGEKQIVVSDWGKDTITILHPGDGRVTKTIDLKGKGPHGLTVDQDENVYVCYYRSREVCAFTPDFEKSKIILTSKELQAGPQDIAYNDKTHELLIGCRGASDTVNCFKLL